MNDQPNVFVVNPSWITNGFNGGSPIRKIVINLPYDELDKIMGIIDDNVLLDVSYLLEDLERFKKIVMDIRENTNTIRRK